MNNLAVTYSELGRHADALAMQEKVLEHLRRVLPADHPDIGEGCAWSDASTSLSFDCDSSLRRLGHEQPCYDVLYAWKARGCSCFV